jgi:hypothetical protein
MIQSFMRILLILPLPAALMLCGCSGPHQYNTVSYTGPCYLDPDTKGP